MNISIKRLLDVLASFLLLLATLPVQVVAALAIKLHDGGPIFFRQERVGKDGQEFFVWKFRTMIVNATKMGLGNPVAVDDHRITRVGRFLRDLGLDELPQLINVLRGEMSLIGPRPCIPYEAEEYLRWHSRRFDITPGMTGLWQVSGKNKTTFKEMIRLDIKYGVERSFLLDTIILLKTPIVVLSQSLGDLGKIKRVGSAEKEKIIRATDKDKIMSAVELA